MLNKIYLWLGAFAAAFIAVFAIHRDGKQKGRQQVEQQQQKEVIKNVEQAKKVTDDVNRLDDDAVRDRLRDKLKRQ